MSGRDISGRPLQCYKLLKALYGLKQSHLAWHKRLCEALKALRFEEMHTSPCVFHGMVGDEK